jgi:hypothetical protein
MNPNFSDRLLDWPLFERLTGLVQLRGLAPFDTSGYKIDATHPYLFAWFDVSIAGRNVAM